MNIGIIGSGHIGGELGRLWAMQGHQIMFGTRNATSSKIKALLEASPNAMAGTLQATVDSSQVLVVALPYKAMTETLGSLTGLDGKIIIDATNKIPPTGSSSSLEIAALHPQADVVKAFNTIGGENFKQPVRNGIASSLLIAGDSSTAKTVVTALGTQLGFAVVDTGGLQNAELLEKLAVVWVGLSRTLGRAFTWKIL
ncbi:MAG: NADPH-dependent F420 reductase [Deinococcales bacterium]